MGELRFTKLISAMSSDLTSIGKHIVYGGYGSNSVLKILFCRGHPQRSFKGFTAHYILRFPDAKKIIAGK